MLLYTCHACRCGKHESCAGERKPPPGVIGGVKCDCDGNCASLYAPTPNPSTKGEDRWPPVVNLSWVTNAQRLFPDEQDDHGIQVSRLYILADSPNVLSKEEADLLQQALRERFPKRITAIQLADRLFEFAKEEDHG